MENWMKLELEAKSENESFARVAAASFFTVLDPTLEEIADIKTAVSEAVTNSIIHGYQGKGGSIWMECSYEDDMITIVIEDKGVGIEDVEQARQPLFTTKPEEERSGMGFVFMEVFMDELEVESEPGKGTKITMRKKVQKEEQNEYVSNVEECDENVEVL